MLITHKILHLLTAQANYMSDQVSTRKMATSCHFLRATPLVTVEHLQTILDSLESILSPFFCNLQISLPIQKGTALFSHAERALVLPEWKK